MSKFGLHFSKINFVHDINSSYIQSENNLRFFTFQNGILYELRYENDTMLVRTRTKDEFEINRLQHVFAIGQNYDLLIASTSQKSIRTYIFDGQNVINSYNRTIQFHWTENDNDIIFGRFHNDYNEMGAIVLANKTVQFFEIINLSGNYVFRESATNTEIIDQICPERWEFMLVNLRKEPKQMIITTSENGVCVFQFDTWYNIRLVMKILYPKNLKINKNDKVFFANLSGHDNWMDMIVLATNGLFLFEYRKETYEIISYNPKFSIKNGWTEKYTQSVRFVDVDDDGFDDIIFTGPRGIEILSYDVFMNVWKERLYIGDLKLENRYSTILHVLPRYDDVIHNPILLTSHSGRIHFANIIEKQLGKVKAHYNYNNENFSFAKNNTVTVPKMKSHQTIEESRSTIYLRHQNIWPDQSETINPQTGKPFFVLHLVGSFNSKIKFHLSYDAASDTTDSSFGIGWSMAQNFVALKCQDTNFHEDEEFVIVIDNVPHDLIQVPSNSTYYDLYNFEIEMPHCEGVKSNIQAMFYRSSSTWHIYFASNRKQFYGKYDRTNLGATITDIAWDYWRGFGFDKTNTIEQPNIWFIAISEIDQITNYYEYEIIRKNNPMNNISYNATVLLKKIYNTRTELNFLYNDNNLVSSYFYKTKTAQQLIHFKYKTIGKMNILTEINQESDYAAQPVIQFNYSELKKGKQVLDKMILPMGIEINYDYKLLGATQPIDEANFRKIPVGNEYNLSYGPDFILVSWVKNGFVVFRMFNYELSEEIYPSLDDAEATKIYWPHTGENTEAYEISIGRSFFAVIVYNSPYKSICLFGRRANGSWTSKYCLHYDERTAIAKGNTFFVVYAPSTLKLLVIEWFRFESVWKISNIIIDNGLYKSIAADGSKFAFYDDNFLFFGYKNPTQSDNWIVKKLRKIPKCLSETNRVLNKFQLKHEFKDVLFEFFKNNALHLRKNIIVLTSIALDENNEKLMTKIRAYIIGRDHKIANETYMTVDQDNITELESSKESNSFNDNFTLKYVHRNDIFQIKLGNIFSTRKPQEELNQQIEKEMNSPAKRFFPDLKNYYVSFQNQIIKCRNITYTFGGVKWYRNENLKNETAIKFKSMLLGDKFSLNKTEPQSTIKLYERSTQKVIMDFGIKDIDGIQINYPNYIAFQKDQEEPVTVIEFLKTDKKEIFQKLLLQKRTKLSPLGNALFLILFERNSNGNTILSMFPFSNVRKFLPDFVVATKKIVFTGERTGGSKIRAMGYEYKQEWAKLKNDALHYSSVIVMPGNNRNAYGHYRVTEDIIEIYNAEGEQIKKIVKKNLQKSNEGNYAKIAKDETIFHTETGNCENEDFSLGDQCDFIGFEEYERHGSKWRFENSDIISGSFPLTGDNVLRLNNTSIRRTFQLEFKNQQHVASCWIRTSIENMPELGDIVPYLIATVLTPDEKEIWSFLANIKHQIDDWSCLEVVIDLQFTYLTLEAINQSKAEYLKLEIKVSSSRNVPIDVDHIRFSSLDNDFKINVFDSRFDKPVAIIQPSGAITRQLYDKYEVQIVEINESNQIKEFITYTKGSSSDEYFESPFCSIKITPEKGFYEYFSPVAFRNRWSLTKLDTWEITHATIEHHKSERSNMLLYCDDIDLNSLGIRFLYSLAEESLIQISIYIRIEGGKNNAKILLKNDMSTKQTIPSEGEFLMIKEDKRIIIWIDGRLYIDQLALLGKFIVLEVEGEVKIEEMMIFSRPKVEIIYRNAIGEKIQKISLLSATSVVIEEFLYDELGRQGITVQPVELVRIQKESLTAYKGDLVLNTDPDATDSIWRLGKMKGEIAKTFGHEYAFSETVYEKNPLNYKLRIGFPEFHARKFNFTFMENKFLKNLFIQGENRTYEAEIGPNNRGTIYIYNENDLNVATLMHFEGEKDLLSTFEYDEKGSIIKCRTPKYYSIFGIFDDDLNFIRITQNDESHPLEIRIEYNDNGNPISKNTPDAGRLENIFDNENKLRFMIQYSRNSSKEIDMISYLKYDLYGRLASTGNLKLPLKTDQLLTLDITELNAMEFQQIYYSDNERDPTFRGRILRTITRSHQESVYEEFIFDIDGNLISKRYIIPNERNEHQILSINKQFSRTLLKKIIYPSMMLGEPFEVVYEYDKLGRMVSVGVPGEPNRFILMAYDASNRIISETFSPLSQYEFDRVYKYNEFGNLTEIRDNYLCEEISYNDKSFDRKIYGNGTVTRDKFTAKWHSFANQNRIGVRENFLQNNIISLEESQRCYLELKREGYLNDKNQQTRIFYPNLNPQLSFACTNNTMAERVKEILGKYGFPEEYGFRFDYRHNREIRKAKYFVGNIIEESESFQSDSFAHQIGGISIQESREIWMLLKHGGYIVEEANEYAKPGRSILRESLVNDLRDISKKLEEYTPLVGKLLLKQFIEREPQMPLSLLENIFTPEVSIRTSYANAISEMLSQKLYLQCPIDENLLSLLTDFSYYIPDIIHVIQNKFGMDRSEFDVELNELDSNGNHICFNFGFDNFILHYEDASNRVSYISKSNSINRQAQVTFVVRYDSRGNVVEALHKGIQSLKYHPVSNRVQKVVMRNGNTITFYYDSKGERFLKRVTNNNGDTILEKHYLRDENGRTLVERKLSYETVDQDPDMTITMYIYGPKWLVGFIRHNQFHSVFMDHQGSVRLVVCEGEVVAAYDYMPYGELMRAYESTPEVHISYLYNGQEWDNEIGLYNFHGRIYDPSIGRFYQIDSMEQFLSPYKYKNPNTVLHRFNNIAENIKSLEFSNWVQTNKTTSFAYFMDHSYTAISSKSLISPILLESLAKFPVQRTEVATPVGVFIKYLTVGAMTGEWNPERWHHISRNTWSYAFKKCLHSYSTSVVTHKSYEKVAQNEFHKQSRNQMITKICDFEKLYPIITTGVRSQRNSIKIGDGTLKLTTTATRLHSNDIVSPEIQMFSKEIADVLLRNFTYLGSVDLFQDATILRSTSDLILSVVFLNITLIYTDSHFINPIFFSKNPQLTAVEENPDLIFSFTQNIRKLENLVIKANKIHLMHIDLSKWINEATLFESTFDHCSVKICKKILRTIFNSNITRFDRDLLLSSMEDIKFENDRINKIKEKLLNKKQEYEITQAYWLSNQLNYFQCNERLIKMNFLKKSMKNLNAELLALEEYQKNNLIHILWKKFKEFQMTWLKWQLWNVAELPSSLFPYVTRDPQPKNFTNSNEYYFDQNFQFLSSYKPKDIPDLVGYQKCYTCIRTAPKGRTKLTDMTWLAMLSEKFHRNLKTISRNKTLKETKRRRRSINDTYYLEPIKETKEIKVNKNTNLFGKIAQYFRMPWFLESFPKPDILSFFTFNTTRTNQSESNFWNTIEFGDKLLSQIPFNETLLLAEFFVAKCNNYKLYSKRESNNEIEFLQNQQFACKVIQLYDESVTAASDATRIGHNRLNKSGYPELYNKILQLARRKSFHNIFHMLMEYALYTLLPKLHVNCPERLSRRKFKYFEKYLCGLNLAEKIDEIRVKMQLNFIG